MGYINGEERHQVLIGDPSPDKEQVLALMAQVLAQGSIGFRGRRCRVHDAVLWGDPYAGYQVAVDLFEPFVVVELEEA